MIEIGKMNELKVLRKSDLGYMLSDGKEEILMHFKQATKELIDEEEVSVYVYTDKANRKTATMFETALEMDKPDFVHVVNVIPEMGVFVDNHTPKDLLVSKDYLPYDYNLWPIVGDVLFCGLKVKKDALMAKPLNRFDIKTIFTNVSYAEGEQVESYVMRIAEKGLGLITVDKVYVFVPFNQTRGTHHMGQKVIVTITKMINGEGYGTLNEHKEVLMDTDKESIINYLESHGGIMYLTAKSSAEEVEKIFTMSRKAFKRAYGSLYKDQLIYFDESKTYFKK